MALDQYVDRAVQQVDSLQAEGALKTAVKVCYGCTLLLLATGKEQYAAQATDINHKWSILCT
jgi:hypothetical protein